MVTTQDARYQEQRGLRVFLCHSSGDKPAVRDLYQRLRTDGFQPWLDEEELIPGKDWRGEISREVRTSDVVLVCLSKTSVNKDGFVQKEIKFALDKADEKPEGTIFIIPVRLEAVEVPPRLAQWHWVNLFQDGGYQKLIRALQVRGSELLCAEAEQSGKRYLVQDQTPAREDGEQVDKLRLAKDDAEQAEKPRMAQEAAERTKKSRLVQRRAPTGRGTKTDAGGNETEARPRWYKKEAEDAKTAIVEGTTRPPDMAGGNSVADEASGNAGTAPISASLTETVATPTSPRQRRKLVTTSIRHGVEKSHPLPFKPFFEFRQFFWSCVLLGIIGLLAVFGVVYGVEALFKLRRSYALKEALKDGTMNSRDGLTYIWVPPGTFQMGCTPSPYDSECTNHEQAAHTVTIAKGFWIGQTPVTQSAYVRMKGTNPSNYRGDQLPVDSVPWEEARTYCSAIGLRLPTEEEWEYAARAGATASVYGLRSEIAWYYDNSDGQTHEVAEKQPNAWKLYDMLGNVMEWTTDWYNYDYSRASLSHPQQQKYPMLRGSTFERSEQTVRFSSRELRDDVGPGRDVGFRCVGEALPDVSTSR